MRIGIIGAGVLGLSIASKLSRQNHEVTVFESSKQIGGMAEAWQLGNITWDKFYHVISRSDTQLLTLLSELGLEKKIKWKKTNTGFFIDNELHSFSNIVDYLRFPSLNLVEKFRLGFTILLCSKISNGQYLSQKTALEWLTFWSGKSVTQKIWIPLLKSKLGDACEHVSAEFIWGSINRFYEARGQGLHQEEFGYVEGGYATILDAWKSHLVDHSVKLETESHIVNIISSKEAVYVQNASNSMPFDQVVLTCPMLQTMVLCPQLDANIRANALALPYVGIVCASMLLRKALPQFYVTNIADRTIPLTGVINMSALTGTECFEGQTLLYLPYYAPPDSSLFEETENQSFERCFSAVNRVFKGIERSDVAEFRVAKLKHVFCVPCHGNGHSRTPMRDSNIKNISFINTAHIKGRILTVNESLKLADEWLHNIM